MGTTNKTYIFKSVTEAKFNKIDHVTGLLAEILKEKAKKATKFWQKATK